MHEGAKRTPERRETEGCAGTSSRFRRARCGEAGASSRRRSASDVRSEIRATLRAPPSSGTPRRRGLRQRVPAGRADVRSATSWIGAAVTPSPSSAGPSHVRTVCGWRGQSRTVKRDTFDPKKTASHAPLLGGTTPATKTLPVARRVLGESNQTTLMTRWNYAGAICNDTTATLAELREAVNTLEEVERTARRVLGGSHPLTRTFEDHLRDTRVALAAREDVSDILFALLRARPPSYPAAAGLRDRTPAPPPRFVLGMS